ncbi:MAG TPA: molecular chaperone DnaJ [Caulobacteraceae bacterium]|nr:molecular chaperone DnaJ [Caulobacteraceae bacterium]
MSAVDLSPDEARAILGLATDASPHDVIGAFRAAAKQSHPDLPGGDAVRFREILSAYHLLQSLPRTPPPAPPPQAVARTFSAFAEIGPMTALLGGEAEALLADGRRIGIVVPAGARHGEVIEAAGERIKLRIRAETAIQVRGADLWVSVEAPARLLEDGGRATVETPLGPKALWITGKIAERRLVRLEGQGLPARGDYPAGSLFIRLIPDSGAPESPARAQLKKFAAAWAA